MSQEKDSEQDEREVQWKRLNEEHGGRLEERVREIRLDTCGMSRIEAKVSALAEIGYNPMQTAIVLGIEEHSVENYRSDIRKKKKVPRGKGKPFDMIFSLPPEKITAAGKK